MAPKSHRPLVELTLLKVRSLLREPEALFWVFVFPVLLAVALGVAFRSHGPDELRIGVQAGEQAGWIVDSLEAAEGLRPERLDEAESRARLRSGKVALVVIPGDSWVYWFDPVRPDSRRARLEVDDALQRAAGRRDVREVATLPMTEKGSRYIDFLMPGLLGMNLMSTGLWGIGFNIVSARSKRLLKRFMATPMRRSHYLLSQITGRLVFLVAEVSILLLVARLIFDVPVRGSWVALLTVSLLGAMSFAGMGLLCASRVRTVEGLSGLVNLVMMPMWILSGIFFSTTRFPDAMQPIIQALPLTAVNDAIRAVLIDGASLAAVGGELGIVAAWGAVCFAVALRWFRWE